MKSLTKLEINSNLAGLFCRYGIDKEGMFVFWFRLALEDELLIACRKVPASE